MLIDKNWFKCGNFSTERKFLKATKQTGFLLNIYVSHTQNTNVYIMCVYV